MSTFNELTDVLHTAVKDIKSLGYEVGTITDFSVNNRYRRAWAKCYRTGRNTFKIGINPALLKANPESARSTIYHEVIHTVPGCYNHGVIFGEVAVKSNRHFHTCITRTTSRSEMMNGKTRMIVCAARRNRYGTSTFNTIESTQPRRKQ